LDYRIPFVIGVFKGLRIILLKKIREFNLIYKTVYKQNPA